jgi:putative membrane protein
VYWVIVLWSVLVVYVLEEIVGHESGFPPDVAVYQDMQPIPLILISVGLMFLVVFRTQTSYQKWSLARTSWVNVNTASRELAMQSMVYMKDFDAACALVRYLLVFVLSLRFWLREEELSNDLIRPLLTPVGLEYLNMNFDGGELQEKIDADPSLSMQFKKVCHPLPVLEVMRDILDFCVETKSMGPFQGQMEGNFKALSMALATMERVLDTQIPFAYITHVRTAIVLYSMAIPFFLTVKIGWFTVVFVAFYCYVVMGLENLAVEIENPFGTDTNDLPMDSYCCQIARDIVDIVRRKEEVMVRLLSQDGDT